MKINIAEQLLPEVYNRHGKDCYLDPIRQKLIYITPEETVRQRMISYLVNELKVPKGAILVEEKKELILLFMARKMKHNIQY